MRRASALGHGGSGTRHSTAGGTDGQRDQAIAYAVFAVIATLGVAAPVVMFFALGDRSGRILAGLRDWMAQHNAVIMAVLCLIIGAKLIGDAISNFSA